MKQKFKPLVLITLLVVLLLLVILPEKDYAVTEIWPGQLEDGPYGMVCDCPEFPYYSCGCRVRQPKD